MKKQHRSMSIRKARKAHGLPPVELRAAPAPEPKRRRITRAMRTAMHYARMAASDTDYAEAMMEIDAYYDDPIPRHRG